MGFNTNLYKWSSYALYTSFKLILLLKKTYYKRSAHYFLLVWGVCDVWPLKFSIKEMLRFCNLKLSCLRLENVKYNWKIPSEPNAHWKFLRSIIRIALTQKIIRKILRWKNKFKRNSERNIKLYIIRIR